MTPDAPDPSAGIVPLDRRKLIAVVYADMVGYSRLISLDDADVLARLQELRRDLIDPALLRHGGTLVNTAGDSLLISFNSIISAVRFAVDIQRGVPEFDADYPSDRQVRFRMAVNVGDVIPEGTNLHGEGVNIAARLQGICPPGAICVTRVIRDHVGNRLGLTFKEMGAIDLRNIAQPTEAFLIELSPVATLPPLVAHGRPTRRTTARIGTALLGLALLCGLSVITWWRLHPAERRTQVIAGQAADSNLPPLSIAVLPFENLSGDPEQAYLADGISEDLTTDLSHLDNAFVIARESAFSYRGKAVDVRDVGRQLGVRYVLEGSVRKISSFVRITAQLIATDTGAHLWAEHFDKPTSELGEGQDDIVAHLLLAIADMRTGRIEEAQKSLKEAMAGPSMREVTARTLLRDFRQFGDTYGDDHKISQERQFVEDLRRAGLRDHLDEDADSGVPSTSELQGIIHLDDPTPMTIPGGRMVRTPEVISMLATQAPLVLTTCVDEPTVPGAIYVAVPETGSLQDDWQPKVQKLMQELIHGDHNRQIIVFACTINRWISRNLALRIMVLGYTNVAWYRGGWEAWDASGTTKGRFLARRSL